MAEVIRDAMGLYNWALDAYDQGLDLGTIKKEDGEVQQVIVLPFAMRETSVS